MFNPFNRALEVLATAVHERCPRDKRTPGQKAIGGRSTPLSKPSITLLDSPVSLGVPFALGMLTRLTQLLLVWFAVIGMLVQSMWGAVPAGHGLCIGCEQSEGWGVTISQPCAATQKNCCAEHEEEASREPTSGSVIHATGHCGCIDIPIGGSLGAVVAGSTRPNVPAVQDFKPLPQFHCTSLVFSMSSGLNTSCWARAGPAWADGPPPRLLIPRARCTIYTV